MYIDIFIFASNDPALHGTTALVSQVAQWIVIGQPFSVCIGNAMLHYDQLDFSYQRLPEQLETRVLLQRQWYQS